jgi:signal transduction histidine kinase
MTAPRIIAVEDERIVALHLKQQLQNLGYEVPAVTASGEAALASIIEHRPDLVLMDIHIEGAIDGVDTAAQIPAELGIPVIYLTAYSEEATLERARATKPYGYLIKPYSERELHATIQMALARRDVERALRTSEDQLRQAQKMEAIGQLTGGVAHDFNNLLGVIIGNLDLLRSLRPDDGELGELTDDALNAALGGAELTRRLLAFARRQPLQPQRVDLTALVGGTVKLLRRVLGDNIEVSLELAKDTGPVMADPAQLEAALTNLATNARDAMPAGGKLMIATAKTHLDAAYAALRPDVEAGDYAMVEVTDTGEGMAPEVIERIFEPFYTTKGRDRGTGLGLSMVFGFLKQSGGHVAVYSEVGVGTTFRLYLPSLTGAAASAAPAQPMGPIQGRGETVLVVEDNDALRRIALRELRALGYQVSEAASGVAALARLESEPVDLLFSDVVMPGGIDGVELARAAMARWPGLHVVLTSGFPQTKLEDVFQPTGFRLLTKPYRRADLARVLRELLDSAEAAS